MRRRLSCAVSVLFTVGVLVAEVGGQLFATPTAAPATVPLATVPLTVDQAVARAISASLDLQGATGDWKSAVQKSIAARLQMLPALSVSGSYVRLSDLGSTTFNIPFGGTSIAVAFPAAPDNSFNLSAQLQYPIFSGFRLAQAAKIAELQATAKQDSLKILRNALTFEAKRAYWEAVRATGNAETLKQNLDLTLVLQKEVEAQLNQGVATTSDKLSVDQQVSQASVAYEQAISMRNQAYITLAALFGDSATADEVLAGTLSGSAAAVVLPYSLTSDVAISPDRIATVMSDASTSLKTAVANRGEVHAAMVATQIATRAMSAANGGLWPTVAIIGDYTYANPNQRVFPSTDTFTGTWDVGVEVHMNVGGIPATLANAAAAKETLSAAQSALETQENSVMNDVRTTLLALSRASDDLLVARSAVSLAQEGLRVAEQMNQNGLAKHSDVLKAQLSLLKSQFAVTNSRITLQISLADYQRAVGE